MAVTAERMRLSLALNTCMRPALAGHAPGALWIARLPGHGASVQGGPGPMLTPIQRVPVTHPGRLHPTDPCKVSSLPPQHAPPFRHYRLPPIPVIRPHPFIVY